MSRVPVHTVQEFPLGPNTNLTIVPQEVHQNRHRASTTRLPNSDLGIRFFQGGRLGVRLQDAIDYGKYGEIPNMEDSMSMKEAQRMEQYCGGPQVVYIVNWPKYPKFVSISLSLQVPIRDTQKNSKTGKPVTTFRYLTKAALAAQIAECIRGHINEAMGGFVSSLGCPFDQIYLVQLVHVGHNNIQPVLAKSGPDRIIATRLG